MFSLYTDLPVQIFLLHIHRGHLCSQILCLYSDGRQEVGKRSFLRSAYTAFHHGCVEPE